MEETGPTATEQTRQTVGWAQKKLQYPSPNLAKFCLFVALLISVITACVTGVSPLARSRSYWHDMTLTLLVKTSTFCQTRFRNAMSSRGRRLRTLL